MSRPNLELVRDIYAEWERGDYGSAGWAHPEIEFVVADGPAPGRWTGLSGLAEGWGDFLHAWTELRNVADEFRELDEGRVLVLSRFRGRGRTSGLPVADMGRRAASLFEVRGGRVTRLVLYWELDRALAELGEPPPGPAGRMSR